MMSIIEKEIVRRDILISEKTEKEQRIAELKAEVARLEQDVANTDVATLVAEIEELKTYLPKPVEEATDAEEVAVDESVEAEAEIESEADTVAKTIGATFIV